MNAIASALVALLAAIPQDDAYVSPDHGLRLAIPEGWGYTERSRSEEALDLVLYPEDRQSEVQLTLRVSLSSFADTEAVRAEALATVGASDAYYDVQTFETALGERQVLGLRVDTTAAGDPLRLRQLYLIENGILYVLQDVAAVDEFDALTPTFDGVWEGLELTPLSAGRAGAMELRKVAARCGSEIDWADGWEQAAERARDEDKLILVYARFYSAFALSDEGMSGTFMDPDVIALVNARYVPMRLTSIESVPFKDAELYGLSPTTFGTALMLVTPEGEVVREASSTVFDFLVEGVSLHPDYPGPAAPALAAPIEQAERHLDRGELEAAAKLLENPHGARGFRLKARLLRLQRQGAEALLAIEAARKAKGGAAMVVDLDMDAALLGLRLGRTAEAHATFARIAREHPEHPRALEARYRMGSCAHVLEGAESAAATWRALVADHPDDRWAWKAAAALTSTSFSVGEPGRLDWAPEELYYAGRYVPYETVPTSAVAEAERDAIEYLLDRQLADGSWPHPAEVGNARPEEPMDFTLADTAICAQALLPHRENEEVRAAIERALAWLPDAFERARAEPRIYFMDYTVWSDAYLLFLFADAVEAELIEPDDLGSTVAKILAELEAKQRPGGGWSYYVTSDIGTETNAGESISFTTAAIVLALLRTDEAGFELNYEVLDRGLECLGAMRNPNGTFEYMLRPGAGGPRSTARPGAAGRGPVCSLARYRGGRAELDEIRESLAIFEAHALELGRELGKSLMHSGSDGQGCHYLLFDYATTAAAIAELPEGERPKHRLFLLDEILKARSAEGGFRDTPLNGWACGTGLALQAFHELRPLPGR